MNEPFKPFCANEPHFDGECLLSPLNDGRRWEVERAFSYHNGKELHVHIPKGFVTDLASVPRIFWAIFPPFGTYTRAAVTHDVLFRNHSLGRAICDGIFLEAMKTCGTGWFTRYTLWFFVRLFGWIAFNRKRKEWRA